MLQLCVHRPSTFMFKAATVLSFSAFGTNQHLVRSLKVHFTYPYRPMQNDHYHITCMPLTPPPPQQAVLFLNCCPITKIDKFPTYVQLIINMYRQEDFTAFFAKPCYILKRTHNYAQQATSKCRSTYSDQGKHYCRKVLHNHLLDLIDNTYP